MRLFVRTRRGPGPSERLLALEARRDPGALLEAARDPSVDVARRALAWLARDGGEREREALRELVWTCDEALVGDVAATLRALGDVETFDTAVTRLRSGPSAGRCRAARVLDRLGDRRARGTLIVALGDRLGSVRAAALDALAGLGRDRSAAAAAGGLVGDPEVDVRRRAVRSLGRLGDEPAALERAATDASPSVRREAARLSRRLPAAAVAQLLADREVEVRVAVAGGAGRGAEAVLADALEHDPHPRVRLAAAERLGVLGGTHATGALVDVAVGDPDALVRARALHAAGDLLTGAELADFVREQLDAPAAARRAMALRTLARLGSRLSASEASRIVRDPSAAVRRALAEVAVEALDAPASVLAELRSDADHGVRHAAAGSASRRPLPHAAGSAAAELVLIVLGAALTAGLIVLGLSAPAIRARRSKEPQRAPRRIAMKAPDAAVLLAAFGVAIAVLVAILLALNGGKRPPAAVPGARPATRPVPAADRSGWVASPGMWLLAGATLVAGGTVVVWLRGRPRGAGPIAPLNRPASGAPHDDTQPWPTDPREAVLSAYRRSETLLASRGLARRSAEGPREFRDRVRSLDAVDGPALARLTALYERARFSRHGITDAMGAEAVQDHARLGRRLEDTWTS
jgi:HEAT repeat protein